VRPTRASPRSGAPVVLDRVRLPPTEPAGISAPCRPPGLARRAVLRFAFCYWLLFCIPIITTQINGRDRSGKLVHLELEGKVGADDLRVRLERFDPTKMLLMSRGFRWINEEPFNR